MNAAFLGKKGKEKYLYDYDEQAVFSYDYTDNGKMYHGILNFMIYFDLFSTASFGVYWLFDKYYYEDTSVNIEFFLVYLGAIYFVMYMLRMVTRSMYLVKVARYFDTSDLYNLFNSRFNAYRICSSVIALLLIALVGIALLKDVTLLYMAVLPVELLLLFVNMEFNAGSVVMLSRD